MARVNLGLDIGTDSIKAVELISKKILKKRPLRPS